MDDLTSESTEETADAEVEAYLESVVNEIWGNEEPVSEAAKEEPEKPDVKELEEALNVDEIKEGATDLQKQAQEAITEAVDETIKTTEKHISKNQVLR